MKQNNITLRERNHINTRKKKKLMYVKITNLDNEREK